MQRRCTLAARALHARCTLAARSLHVNATPDWTGRSLYCRWIAAGRVFPVVMVM
jgi:hypothetical protein